MIVFRLCRSAWKNDLSGRGAEITGGRWNSKGTAMVYTSSSRALCTAEIAVHTPLGILPSDYMLVEIALPEDASIFEYPVKKLPVGWMSFPYDHQTQIIGDRFILDAKYLLMKVPSAVVQGDFNFLVNPRHPQFRLVRIVHSELFSFDKRLFK
jgi:RES domain-containing protein